MAVAGLIGLALALQAGADTTIYASPATRALVELAQARHRAQESAVTDYRARLRFRVSFALGRRSWARVPTFAVEETDATLHWQAPNDLRVDIVGRRARARNPDAALRTFFNRPWFFPRQPGDSIRLFGEDFPEQAAVHPLAAAGPANYRYALTDSQRVVLPGGEAIRLQRVEVRPRVVAPALVAGFLWLDATTGEVVRFSFRFVGQGLWQRPDAATATDSAEARRANRFINRILELEADLEYGLEEGRHWMPHRQTISGRVRVPFVGDVIVPFESETRFDDYAINGTGPVRFTLDPPPPDSARPDAAERRRARREARSDSLRAVDVAGRWGGGRFQIHRAPVDSLRMYDAWGDSLTLERSGPEAEQLREVAGDLARLAEALPPELTGRRLFGLGVERLGDVFRYQRVSGISLGFGVMSDLPGVPFVRAWGGGRYGVSDGRLGLRGALVREAPGGRWTLAAYREVTPVEPAPAVGPLANSVNALLTGHDNGEYLRAAGASLTREQSLGVGVELAVTARLEQQRSVGTAASNLMNDLFGGNGRFPANPRVRHGTYAGGEFSVRGLAGRAAWRLTADGLGDGDVQVGRLSGSWRQPLGGRRGFTLELQGGASAGDSDSLPQRLFRLGGLGSVRGLEYGRARGPAYWAARADWTPRRDRRARLVLFADVGQAAALAALGTARVHAGAGVGVSFLGGLGRVDLSHPLTPRDGALRLDLVFGGPR